MRLVYAIYMVPNSTKPNNDMCAIYSLRQQKPNFCLAFRAREGLVGELDGRRPLRLAFRAREGLVGGWKKEGPSHVLSEGGVGGCGGRNTTQKGGGS